MTDAQDYVTGLANDPGGRISSVVILAQSCCCWCGLVVARVSAVLWNCLLLLQTDLCVLIIVSFLTRFSFRKQILSKKWKSETENDRSNRRVIWAK